MSDFLESRSYRDVFAPQDDPLAANPALLGEGDEDRNLLDHTSESTTGVTQDAQTVAEYVAAQSGLDIDDLMSEQALSPEMIDRLQRLVADFDEEELDNLERALAGVRAPLEDLDEILPDYEGRITIDTGMDVPNLDVVDTDSAASVLPNEEPTEEDYAALQAVEAELDTRWGERQIAPDLGRMERLMDMLGHPEQAAPVIQVAGTNGKTSTARMIDALLRAMGQRVGRTTSPHLQLATERISVDGRPISPRRYVEVWEDIKPFVELVDAWSLENGGPRMTKFEVLTAMAYACFADTPVDVVVAEVGMGGRWDATSVARAEVAVLCPIGLDHQDYLGDTLADIAAEKAGIIKETAGENTAHNPHGTIAVIAHQDPAALHVLLEEAVAKNAVVARQGMEFEISSCSNSVGGQVVSIQGLAGSYENLFIPLYGEHQAENAAVALAAVEAFYGANVEKPLYDRAVRNGFAAVMSPGRLERVRTGPTTLIDAAHNPHGARALAAALQRDFDFNRLIGVVGVLSDKDAVGILRELEPVLDKVVITKTTSPRAYDIEELAELAGEVFDRERILLAPSLADAVELATVEAEDINDSGVLSGAGIIITGSVVTAGQARSLFRKEPA